MKNLNIIFMTLLFSFIPASLQAQGWTVQNSGTTNTLNCAYFVNSNTGWLVGNGGTILYTTNGGDNWGTQNSGVPYTLNGVFFINGQTGYICGYNGLVFKTINAGSNWFYSNNGILNTYILNRIKFANSNTGYASGTGGKIFKTTNGGSSWDTVFSFFSQYYTTYDLLFIDANTGWSCMSSNYIYRTSNGGYNWSLVGGGGAGYNSRSITRSESFFWVCRQYATDLARSDNGLVFYQLSNNLNMVSYSICFLNDFTGYAAGVNGIKKSTNSGENWSTEYSASGVTFYSIFVIDSVNIWCAGMGGKVVAKRTPTGIGHIENLPNAYSIEQNYPNPFNPSTNIQYDVPKVTNVTLKVYDIRGREVATLVSENKQPGSYIVTFDAGNYASGVYFYKLSAGDFTRTMKMILVK